MNKSDIDKRQTIKYLNRVLEEAIYHGGDGGGAYFSNEKALHESLQELLEHLKLSDMCKIIINENEMMQLEETLSKEKNIAKNDKAR